MPKKNEDRPLSRTEATLVADWMKQDKNIVLPSGWISVYRLRPSIIANRYNVNAGDVNKAARREEG